MAHVKDIHSKAMIKLRQLLVDENDNERFCVIRFPDSVNNNLKNAIFNFVPCLTSSTDNERLKRNDNLFSDEGLIFTIMFEDIQNIKNTINTVTLPKQGFKNMRAKLIYNNKSYIIKEEQYSEFANAIELYCDIKE